MHSGNGARLAQEAPRGKSWMDQNQTVDAYRRERRVRNARERADRRRNRA